MHHGNQVQFKRMLGKPAFAEGAAIVDPRRSASLGRLPRRSGRRPGDPTTIVGIPKMAALKMSL